MVRKINLTLDPFFQAIINKNPIDWLTLIKNTEDYIKATNDIDLDDQDVNNMKELQKLLWNNLIDLKFIGSDAYVLSMVILSKITSIPRKILDPKTEKDKKEYDDFIKEAKSKSSNIPNILMLMYDKIQENLSNSLEINDDIEKAYNIFERKLQTYGAYAIGIDKAIDRDYYLVFLPTYLYLYFDNYVRPEILGENYNSLRIFDARTSFQDKIAKDDSFVPIGNVDYVKDMGQVTTFKKVIENSLNDEDQSDKLKTFLLSTYKTFSKSYQGESSDQYDNDLTTLIKTSIPLIYYYYPGPTGAFFANLGTYRTEPAILENTIVGIITTILEAMGETGMPRLPQYDNPKIIEENRGKLRELIGFNGLGAKDEPLTYMIPAIWIDPIPMTKELKAYKIPQEEKMTKNSEKIAKEIRTKDMEHAQKLIREPAEKSFLKSIANSTTKAKILGPQFGKLEAKPKKVTKSIKDLEQVCTLIKTKKELNELIRGVGVKESEIEGNTLEKKCNATIKIIQERAKNQ
jgi:hypothetical protein